MNQYEYLLKNPVQYSVKGDFAESNTVVMYEFNSNHDSQYYKLNQMITKIEVSAMKQVKEMSGLSDNIVSKHDDSDEDDTKSIFEVLKIGASTSNVDIDELVSTFKQMACHNTNPVCKLDGEHNLKSATFDSIHPREKLNMVLAYCAFFGIGSLMTQSNG